MKKSLLAIFVLLAIMALPRAGFCEGATVAVFPIKNNGQAQMNGLSAGMASMFATDLLKARGISVIDPQRVGASLRGFKLTGGAPSTDDAIKAAGSLGADYALVGEFIVFGNRFRIDIRLYDVKAGALRTAEKAQAKEDELFDTVDTLSGRIILALSGSIPPAPSGLRVESDPAGAMVYVDGNRIGVSPLNIPDAGPGQHKVDLNLEGYQDYSDTVSVKEGESAKLEAKLIRLFGGVRIWWQGLPSSDISFAGESIPAARFRDMDVLTRYCRNVPAGSYTVVSRMPSKDESSWDSAKTWKTYKAEVDINPGEVTDIYLNNDYRAPVIQVSACGDCVANWDFTAKISWYETR